MGLCGENVKKREERDKNKRQEKKKKFESRIIETKRNILDVETKIDILEKEIISLRNEIESPTGEGTNELKLNDKKRDLIAKIRKYKSFKKYRNTLKNNLDTMENKINENNLVGVLEENNKILGDMNDGNDKIIQGNISNLKEQIDQHNLNEKLIQEGDVLLNGNLNKYEIDAEINGFFKEIK